MKNRLGLYTHVFPALARKCVNGTQDDKGMFEDFASVVTFDCRELPREFVEDTGVAAAEEAIASDEQIFLPFGAVWFEFSNNFGVLALIEEHAVLNLDEAEARQMDLVWINENAVSLGVQIKLRPFIGWDSVWPDDEMPLDQSEYCGYFTNNVKSPTGLILSMPCEGGGVVLFHEVEELSETENKDPVPFFDGEIGETPVGIIMAKAAALVLGALTLLREKLVIDRVETESNPRLEAKRKKQGIYLRPPETHVLTVNVPAVRYAASRSISSRGNSHDAPCLHWRRGHWRTLHRGSEFERQTWVPKCLVGDPDKGFAPPQYKLVHNMPMPEGRAVIAEALGG